LQIFVMPLGQCGRFGRYTFSFPVPVSVFSVPLPLFLFGL
jgi:hypothetical protein